MVKVKNIIIRMPNWLGDAVMALEALYALKQHFKGARLTILVKGSQVCLFQASSLFDEVFELDLSSRFNPRFNGGQRVLPWLKKKRFCLGILFTSSFSSALLFRRGLVKSVIGYRRVFDFFLLQKSVALPKNRELHMSEFYLRLVQALGVVRCEAIKIIGVQDATKHLEPFKLPPDYILISPTAAYGSSKCWPLERFWALAKKLVALGLNVVISAQKQLFCPFEHPLLHNLSQKTSLVQLLALIQEAKVVVANDSGPLHVASHMRRPLVAFFGPTSVEKAEPYKGSSILSVNASCSPCYKRVCPIDFRCMLQISIDKAFDAVIYQLKRLDRIAVAILAGGKGQRLNMNEPKAILPLANTTLLKHHILQIPKEVKIFVLTSPFTHKAIGDYLLEHNSFERQITLYSKRVLPCTNLDGSKSQKSAPEGNGAFYDCIVKSGFFDKYPLVEVVNCIPIDNPLAKPMCLDLIYCCLEERLQAAFSCVERDYGDAIGVLCQNKHSLSVVEYTDSRVENLDSLEARRGFANLFCVRKEFIFEACKKEFSWHRVQRGELFHFERWIFDPFNLISNYKIFMRDKYNYFYPLKSKDDLEKVEQILYNRGKENLGV